MLPSSLYSISISDEIFIICISELFNAELNVNVSPRHLSYKSQTNLRHENTAHFRQKDMPFLPLSPLSHNLSYIYVLYPSKIYLIQYKRSLAGFSIKKLPLQFAFLPVSTSLKVSPII